MLRKIFSSLQTAENTCRILSNTELDSSINGADLVRFMKPRRIGWLGHIQRMDTSRLAKIILEWKPVGSHRTGRPRIRWLDDVCNIIKVMNVRTGDKQECLE
jgi:hypothetical protein